MGDFEMGPMTARGMRWENVSTRRPDDAVVGTGCELAPSVKWGAKVRLGHRVRIAPDVVLAGNVTIGDDCFVGPGCVLGEPAIGYYRDPAGHAGQPTQLGAGSVLRTGTILYEDVAIGEGFQSGPYVCVREKTRIGAHCSVGNQGDVQPDVVLGDYTRLHSGVHVAEGARIGKYVWIMPNCTFTNDNAFPVFCVPEPPVVGPYCVLGTGSLFYPGVRLGMHVVVAAGSRVKGTHGDFAFLQGDPARKVCDARRFFVHLGERAFLPYPWLKHIDRNYPWKDVPADARRLEDYL
jgi:UDP-3-O-[3-hydroxymyristoyl] glucosamine N-acyltransferase